MALWRSWRPSSTSLTPSACPSSRKVSRRRSRPPSYDASAARTHGRTDAPGWLWSEALPLGRVLTDGAWLHPIVREAATPSPRPRARTSTLPAVTAEHGLVRLLELHRSGASLATVAAALNAEDFRTPAGTRWHLSRVAGVIADAAYPSLDVGD